jgi:hypothetical protein
VYTGDHGVFALRLALLGEVAFARDAPGGVHWRNALRDHQASGTASFTRADCAVSVQVQAWPHSIYLSALFISLTYMKNV